MIIGLTGGIGSGKSTVSRILKDEYAIPIVDADLISREVVKPGSDGIRQLKLKFGAQIIQQDGKLDRTALRKMMAASQLVKDELDAVLHPLIQKEVLNQFSQLRNHGKSLIVYDCPLLFQTHQQRFTDKIMVVIAEREIRIQRIIARDHISRELADKMIKLQMSESEMMAQADVVIDNNGDEHMLHRCVDVLMKKIGIK
ncbi:MAG: dephospho-CoA kinase [Eubacteriaceae bacterium]|nr:dephospho-CoA kinase [Eubacteriaceae bacterium]